MDFSKNINRKTSMWTATWPTRVEDFAHKYFDKAYKI